MVNVKQKFALTATPKSVTNVGCRRESECKYLHVTLACNERESFKCEGCKDVWTDKTCVVEHVITGHNCYFCLNCTDWIHYKANVLDEGWTLLYSFANLRTNI